MAMGKRKRHRPPAMWVTSTNVPTAASHPFYRRLNQLQGEYGFDDVVEGHAPAFMRRRWAGRDAARDLFPVAADRLLEGIDGARWIIRGILQRRGNLLGRQVLHLRPNLIEECDDSDVPSKLDGSHHADNQANAYCSVKRYTVHGRQ
jgi:hypothetical protein